MHHHRPDVSRLYQHFGLDPSAYLQFRDQSLVRQVGVAATAVRGARLARPWISDPALRAARLRAELLGAPTCGSPEPTRGVAPSSGV